jgi:hypothetical protein
MTSRKLAFGHFGNGLTVWVEGIGTHIAHIDRNRNIQFVEKSHISRYEVAAILRMATEYDGAVSETQDTKVFIEPPVNA